MALHKVSSHKAKKILKHGSVRGHPLTKKQKGLFGLHAGGGRATRINTRKNKGNLAEDAVKRATA